MYNPRARRLLSLQAPEPVTCAAPQVDGTAVLLTGVASGAIHVWQVNTAAQLTVRFTVSLTLTLAFEGWNSVFAPAIAAELV